MGDSILNSIDAGVGLGEGDSDPSESESEPGDEVLIAFFGDTEELRMEEIDPLGADSVLLASGREALEGVPKKTLPRR